MAQVDRSSLSTKPITLYPTLWLLTLALMFTFAVACAEQEDPFAAGDRATATPTPTDAEQAQAEAAATPTATVVPLPTSVPVSLPTSVPAPTAVPTPTEAPPTETPVPESKATAVPSGPPSGSTSVAPSPTPVPEPTATAVPVPTEAPKPSVPPTHTPLPLPADYDRSTEGPPQVELIKFSQWDDNRVKLSNWVAGYMVAHGLDHPVRIIDMNPEDYKDALPHGEVDIVMEADPAWAKPWADAGVIVLLGSLAEVSGDTVIAVNASIWNRAPNVGQFLEKYGWDGDALTNEAKKIRGGRIAIAENVVGLRFLKDQESMWGQWVSADTATLLNEALASDKVNLCRAWEFRQGGQNTRVCKDDPRINICVGCS